MEHDYKITYNLGGGIQTLTFVVTLALTAGTTKEFEHTVLEDRVLNNGNILREKATYRFRILVTAAGLVMTLLLAQRLLIQEFTQ